MPRAYKVGNGNRLLSKQMCPIQAMLVITMLRNCKRWRWYGFNTSTCKISRTVDSDACARATIRQVHADGDFFDFEQYGFFQSMCLCCSLKTSIKHLCIQTSFFQLMIQTADMVWIGLRLIRNMERYSYFTAISLQLTAPQTRRTIVNSLFV